MAAAAQLQIVERTYGGVGSVPGDLELQINAVNALIPIIYLIVPS